MSAGIRLYLSRDKRRDEVKSIQVWFDKPEPTNDGRSFRIYTGKPIASISLENAAKMGDDFILRPGTCKSVMMVTVN